MLMHAASTSSTAFDRLVYNDLAAPMCIIYVVRFPLGPSPTFTSALEPILRSDVHERVSVSLEKYEDLHCSTLITDGRQASDYRFNLDMPPRGKTSPRPGKNT